MVRWWLEHDTCSSWQKLCDALKDLQQERIANQIVSEHPKLKRRIKEKEAREAEILRSNPYLSLSLEDSKHEQKSRDWEVRNEQLQIQHEREERMESAQHAVFAETTSENVEKIIRDLFHKQKIGWVYDALRKSAVDREELELLKERMKVQAEGSKIFKEWVKEIKKKKEVLHERARKFEELGVDFHQDQEELEIRQERLEKLNFLRRWWTYSNDVRECQSKLRRCQERLSICRSEIEKCKQGLERSDIQLSDCHSKVLSCISELRHLQKEYERCYSSVTENIKSLQVAMPILAALLSEWAAWGAKAGATVGAVAGTVVFPVFGTAVGGLVGGVVGLVAGAAVDDLQRKMVEEGLTAQLTRCEKEVMKCKNTLEECRGVAEQTSQEISELEKFVHELELYTPFLTYAGTTRLDPVTDYSCNLANT